MRQRVRGAYFDELYAREKDPWDFETSAYETAKYGATLAALDPPYASALELGCSIGVLTEKLRERVDDLLAVDTADAALEVARARVPTARFERREIPEDWPEGTFGLIVASEVLYYLDAGALEQAMRRIEGSLAPGGSLLAVHWRRPTRTYPLRGDEVHDALARTLGWPAAVSRRTPDYALDRFDRPCGS